MSTAKPLGAFRVLHTADWHLGKLLGENSREVEHGKFLSWLLAVIREQAVDALVIAGDVFDSANPPQSAVTQYYNFLSRLRLEGDCAVVVVAGNHDSPAHLEAPREILKPLGVQVIGLWPDEAGLACIALPNADHPALVVVAVPFLRDRDLRVGVAGQGFQEVQRELVRGIRERYAAAATAALRCAPAGTPILATGHLTVAGCATSDSEREIHIGGLGAVGAEAFSDTFAYVALGHLHRPQKAGRETVRYAGSPIALSFGEISEHKEVRLLDFGAGTLLAQTGVPVPVFRHLTRISTQHAGLQQALRDFVPPACELPAWLEVTVEDPIPGENLYEIARECAAGKNFEVLRVIVTRSAPLAGPGLGEDASFEEAADLLSNPAQIFNLRLDQEPGLTAEERAELILTFTELRSLHQEQQRNEQAPGAS
jgi:exonuclease SbcD